MSHHVSTIKHAIERTKYKQKIAKEYDLPVESILDLSCGDNLFIPPDFIRRRIIKKIKLIDPRDNYPFDYYSFVDELSRFLGLNKGCIYPGLSHNQLIFRILSVFKKPSNKIMLLIPDKDTYYYISMSLGYDLMYYQLEPNYKLSPNEILSEVKRKKPDIILFSSPHFPIGNQFEEEAILTFLDSIDIPVIVDETYVEYGTYSLVNQIDRFDNLIVIRTFSKAWGLGSFSCAYLVASSPIVERIKNSYVIEEIPPINLLVTNSLLRNPFQLIEYINEFINERKKVINYLRVLSGIKVYPSDSNFISLEINKNITKFTDYFLSKGIIVRTVKDSILGKNLDNTLFVTLGNSKINERFTISLVEILEALA